MSILKIVISILAVIVFFVFYSDNITNSEYLYLLIITVLSLSFVTYKYINARKIRSSNDYHNHVTKIRDLIIEEPSKMQEIEHELKKKGYGYPYITDAKNMISKEKELITKIRK